MPLAFFLLRLAIGELPGPICRCHTVTGSGGHAVFGDQKAALDQDLLTDKASMQFGLIERNRHLNLFDRQQGDGDPMPSPRL